MSYIKIKQEKFPIVDIKRNLSTKAQNQTLRYILFDLSMNKGEQRRLYSSQLQKIIKKNIKNNISFSINNYNNNIPNNNQNDFEELYRNINQNKLNNGIRGLNKSLDLSRNKSPIIQLKPSFLIKNENTGFQNSNNLNGIGLMQNNKSVDFSSNDIQRINNLYFKSENLSNLINNSSNFTPNENIFIRNISSN